MKSILYIIVLVISFTSCSTQNAFTHFKLSKKEENSLLNLQNIKITSKENVDGIFSAIFLNKIDSKRFYEYEYFYIYTYLKDKKDTINFLLNEKVPLQIEELEADNRFSNLSAINNKWYSYYLVIFSKQEGDLKLELIRNNTSSTLLTYKKKSD